MESLEQRIREVAERGGPSNGWEERDGLKTGLAGLGMGHQSPLSFPDPGGSPSLLNFRRAGRAGDADGFNREGGRASGGFAGLRVRNTGRGGGVRLRWWLVKVSVRERRMGRYLQTRFSPAD